VNLVADRGHRLLPDYTFDPHTGLWHHRRGPVEPPLRLQDVRFDPETGIHHPPHGGRAGEESLAGYLAEARALLGDGGRDEVLENRPSGLAPDFERLRWFVLPPECLAT
jgi:hypothetical protein